MNPQQKFVEAAAEMEQALACVLKAAVDNEEICPDEIARLLKLITKKEIILSFLLEEVNNFHFKKKRRKKTFRNTTPIWIPETNTRGPASPYPSTIQVSGVKGVIKKITVTFRHLYHTWPRDISAMLVGPDGQNIVLMALTGLGGQLDDVTITFDDDASSQLPLIGQITSGKYQPTNYGTPSFPTPAPIPSTNTHLSIFNGTNPNGIWELYVQDIFSIDTGVMAGGWEMTIITEDPKTGSTNTITVSQENESQNDESEVENESFPIEKGDEQLSSNLSERYSTPLLKDPRKNMDVDKT